MNIAKLNIKENARQLRRLEIARIAHSFFATISDAMRVDHESRLRRTARVVPRLRSINGTPA